MSSLANHGQLPTERYDQLAEAVSELHTLEHVLKWGLAQDPAVTVVEVVVQDEYCHDVVLALAEPHHLVFDTN